MIERLKTALILFVVVSLCMFASKNPLPIQVLLIVTSYIAATEWCALMPKLKYPRLYPAVIAVMSILLLSIYQLPTFMTAAWVYHGTPWLWLIAWGMSSVLWLAALTWVLQYPHKQVWYGAWLMFVGALLICATVTAIFALWLKSPWWLMYVFFIVWAADVGAYLAGRRFGKHKLAPAVSPGKTVEGLCGGLTLSSVFILGVVFTKLTLSGSHLYLFVLLSLLTALASVLGDLFESMLKRRANIKDSGTLLPGHGGVLDRIDSILSATPIFALGFVLLGVL